MRESVSVFVEPDRGVTSGPRGTVMRVVSVLAFLGVLIGINAWLIVVPIVVATTLGLVIPTTLRRRRRFGLGA